MSSQSQSQSSYDSQSSGEEWSPSTEHNSSSQSTDYDSC